MAVTTEAVGAIHWLNWITYAMVIKDDTEIIAGIVSHVRYQPNGGIYEIMIDGTKLKYNSTQVITFGTPSDASLALYGVPLNPQTP